MSGSTISRARKTLPDFTLYKDNQMNSLDKILAAMRTGKYTSVYDPKGNVHVGLVNSIMREDGSGKNWIVRITNKTTNHNVFIHAK